VPESERILREAARYCLSMSFQEISEDSGLMARELEEEKGI
jgi:hypothetical protein